MHTRILAVYYMCDGMSKVLHHKEDPQYQMTDAEIISTSIDRSGLWRQSVESSRSAAGGRLHSQYKRGEPLQPSLASPCRPVLDMVHSAG
jgi:hypothetical protein